MIKLTALTLVVTIAVLVGSAVAGPLATDPAAMPLWEGSRPFNGTLLHATVDFAVYLPGHFSTSAALGAPGSPPPDPSGGQDYVYAYQIITPDTDQSYITDFSVGLFPGAIPNGSTNIGNLVVPGDATAIIPDSSTFAPAVGVKSSAIWSYLNGREIDPNQHSDILYFTSPFGPTNTTASMLGGETVGASLPTPVPEPATAILAALAALGLLAVGMLRKRA